MFDMTLLFIIENIFLLMILFWIFSWLGDRFYKAKYYISNDEVYECGFLSIHGLTLNFNLSYIIIAWLLLLYDIEFFFLIPFCFNIENSTTISWFIFWLFWGIVIASFYFDWSSPIFKWLA